uniref:Uncharacterized protein n=1 Tax=Meloidogyne enterolobii TaxID=390850 RepID=A0A6V7VKQ9_MELEN|nr:unnamed protein product [Meloidogyne enterolobii]
MTHIYFLPFFLLKFFCLSFVFVASPFFKTNGLASAFYLFFPFNIIFIYYLLFLCCLFFI